MIENLKKHFVLTFSLSKGVAVLERRMKAGER